MNVRKNLFAAALAAALLAPALVAPAARAQDAAPADHASARWAPTATGQLDAAAAEIVAYHAATQRAFVVNGGDKTLDILDVSDPANPTLISQVDMTQFGDAATSVDVHGGSRRRGRPGRGEDRPRHGHLPGPGGHAARPGAGRRAARHAHLHAGWDARRRRQRGRTQ